MRDADDICGERAEGGPECKHGSCIALWQHFWILKCMSGMRKCERFVSEGLGIANR